MDDFFANLKIGLQTQVEELGAAIRTHETALTVSKERFLKVEGAMEILNIIAKKYEETHHDVNPIKVIAEPDGAAGQPFVVSDT